KTRWLSLYPCLDILVSQYDVYRDYFIGLKRDSSDESKETSTDKIKNFFSNEDNHLWILTVYELAAYFNETVEKLEADKTTVLEGINAIKRLTRRLKNDQLHFELPNNDESFSSVYVPAQVKDSID